MGILADLVDHVVGIDPDRDWLTAAVVDAKTTGVVVTERFPADRDGYRDLLDWAEATTSAGERAWVVEGTASYGAGVTGALTGAGEWVVEFDRATTKATKDGAKTDALDAIRAAREALGRDRLAQPRAQGNREAVRVHHVARAAAVRARTAAVNELKAFIVTAPERLRAELRGLRTARQVSRCALWRDTPSRPTEERATRAAMRAVACRIQFLDTEIASHDAALKAMLDGTVPQLLAEVGIGYVTAAEFYLAWSHPGRCRSDGAYARLGGAAPIDATSGQTVRHRLNRGGDRQLNRAALRGLHSRSLLSPNPGLHRAAAQAGQDRTGDPAMPHWASISRRATVARSSGAAGDGLDVSPRDGLFELVALAVAGPLIGSRDQPAEGRTMRTRRSAPAARAIWRDCACSVDGIGVRRITACV